VTWAGFGASAGASTDLRNSVGGKGAGLAAGSAGATVPVALTARQSSPVQRMTLPRPP
jgi:hypothetical protein